MPFRFRLQTVLDIARRERDLKAQVLAAKQQLHFQAVQFLEENLQEQETRRQELLAARQGGPVDLETMVWGQQYLGILHRQEQERRQFVTAAESEVEEAREVLMTYARKVQVLERLEERARAAYLKAEERKEAAFIDELATLRHARGAQL